MRKVLTVILIVCLAVLLMGQTGRFFSKGSDVLKVKGATVVTTSSTYFNNYPYLALTAIGVDSAAAADSTGISLYLDYCTTPGTDWAVHDTVTILTESTYNNYYYYPTNHPMLPFVRFRAQGDSTNEKLKSVVLTLKIQGFEK